MIMSPLNASSAYAALSTVPDTFVPCEPCYDIGCYHVCATRKELEDASGVKGILVV